MIEALARIAVTAQLYPAIVLLMIAEQAIVIRGVPDKRWRMGMLAAGLAVQLAACVLWLARGH